MTESWAEKTKKVDDFIAGYWRNVARLNALQDPAAATLVDAMVYSCSSGGKRFRPLIALLVAEALHSDSKPVLAFAASVEFVHTYSLIHDDLPCMDNDDVRRGQPTNHKKFGEPMALLAGDGLLTESFTLLADSYEPQIAAPLVRLLGHAAGVRGMVGGQAIDIGTTGESPKLERLKLMHQMKTGALIQVAAEGAAIVCQASADQIHAIKAFASDLGLAFQIKDDLLDFDPVTGDAAHYPSLLGQQRAVELLQETSDRALGQLDIFDASADDLRMLVRYNLERAK